jgi:hypothetical protein
VAIAPAAPEAGLSFGLIMVALACLFLLALNRAYQFTLGALLTALAGAINNLPHVTILGTRVPPWSALADAVTWLNGVVLNAIGTGIINTEKALHALIGWITWCFQATADEVAGLAEDTARSFEWVKNVLIRSALGVALAPIVAELTHLGGKLKTSLTHPAQVVHTTVRVIAPGLAALTGRVNALEAKVAAIGAEAPAAVAQVPAVIERFPPTAIPGEISRGIDSLWKRVRKIGATLTPAGLVGLVAGATLSTMGLGWLKCGNVEKAAKSACHVNTDVLEGLLTGLLALFGTFSLVEFAKYLTPLVGEMGDEVTHFWRADIAGQTRDRALGSPGLTAK